MGFSEETLPQEILIWITARSRTISVKKLLGVRMLSSLMKFKQKEEQFNNLHSTYNRIQA